MSKPRGSRTRRFIAAAPAVCLGILINRAFGRAAGGGAKVIVTGVETGLQRPTTTTSEGYYSMPSLPPANYTVSAEITGFNKTVSAATKVDTTATVRVDLMLAPQDSKVSIEVIARPPAMETETSMTGDTVTGKELTDLPLNGRNTLELAMTVAGVPGEMGSDEAGIGYNVPSPARASASTGAGRACWALCRTA